MAKEKHGRAADAVRVLLIDLETSPILGYTWGMYEDNVLKAVEPSKIISFAYKWSGDKGISVKALPDYKGYRGGVIDDKALVKDLWDLLDEAHIVIAHNGDSFDVKKANARFIAHGLTPPSFYKTVDTKKVAKRYFRFDSNKLDFISQYLGEGSKINTGGFELWEQCLAGDKSAWMKMKRYNAHDIYLLEKAYLRVRPWIVDHPNFAVIGNDRDACPNCGSHRMQARGFSFTRTGRRQRFQCTGCGAWSSGTHHTIKGALR